MIRKNLMDIVMLSGIRKELLLYLYDGPQSLSEIRERFDITSPEVSPRIKELLLHNIIKFEGKKYHLTPMGKTIVKNLRPFIDTINFFEQYPNYWESHDLASIPDELLYKIGDIKNYMIIEDDGENVNKTKMEGIELVMKSKYLLAVSTLYDNDMIELLPKLLEKKIPISLIISESVYNKIFIDNINSKKIATNNDLNVYISHSNIKTAFIVNDFSLFFSLCLLNGKFDLHSNCISNEESAIKWGKDLFEYYKQQSVKVM